MKFRNIGKIMLLSGALAFAGCQLKMPTDDVKIKIDTDKLLPLQFSIQFVDQATGFAITDKEVKIEISGEGSSKIYEISGTRTFKVANGMINLAIRKDAIPSETNPLKFNVTASAEGYLATTVSLTYTEAESKSFDVALVALNNLPPSITKTSQTFENSNDGLASDITITPDKVSTINTGMSITIPAGTKFLDASGNVLVGNFTAKVYYFSPETDALQYTPQGDENGEITVKYKNNQTAKYLSIDGACAYLEISTGNYFVSSFSKPISVSMDIHKDIMNIETMSQVKAGDSLEFISRGLTGTEWNFQKNTVVQDLGGSNFTAVGQTTSAYWLKPSFGGSGRSLGKAATPCYAKYRFTQTTATCPSTFRLENVSWVSKTNGPILGWTSPSLAQNQTVPSGTSGLQYSATIPATIKTLYDPRIKATPRNLKTGAPGAIVTTPGAPTCTLVGGSYAAATPLNYVLPAGQTCNPILLTVSINCPNLSVTSIPPIYKRVANTTGIWTQLVYIPKGAQFPGQYFVHGLTIGTTYTFKTTYKNKDYSTDITAAGQTMSYILNVAPADCP